MHSKLFAMVIWRKFKATVNILLNQHRAIAYHMQAYHATGAVLPGIETAVFFQTGSGSSWASKVAKNPWHVTKMSTSHSRQASQKGGWLEGHNGTQLSGRLTGRRIDRVGLQPISSRRFLIIRNEYSLLKISAGNVKQNILSPNQWATGVFLQFFFFFFVFEKMKNTYLGGR